MLGFMMDEESVEEKIERLRPKTLPEARIEQLKDVLARVRDSDFEVGDLVMPSRDSGINPAYVGEPHVIIRTRDVFTHGCSPADRFEIATIDADGDVVTAWVPEWKIVFYEPKMEG